MSKSKNGFKSILAGLAVALAATAATADDVGASPASGDGSNLLKKAQGLVGDLFDTVAKSSAKLADSMKDKTVTWPAAAEGGGWQAFPVYPNATMCERSGVESASFDTDVQRQVCPLIDQRLRGTNYSYIVLGGSQTGEQVQNIARDPKGGYAVFSGVNVVVLPIRANSVTCWKADLHGGAKECQALRPLLQDVDFKWIVVPDMKTRAAFAGSK